MRIEKNLISAILIFFLSSLGMALWLYEIVEIKTWNSLSWLNGQLYSPFLATLFSVFSFMTPFFINKKLTVKKAIIPFIIFFTINIICFQIGKFLCYKMNSKCWWLSNKGTINNTIVMILTALSLFIFLGFSYRLTTCKLMKMNKTINTFFITFLLLLAIPLSLLTIQINPGFGSGTDWVDAVKMGYPIFWISMLLGLIGIILAR